MSYNLHQSQSHDVLRSWQSQRNDVNHHKDFVLPMFIGNDDDACELIEAMPEVHRYGGNQAIEYLEPLVDNFGLRAVLLFPVVTKADKEVMKTAYRYETGIDLDEENISSSDSSSSSTSSDESKLVEVVKYNDSDESDSEVRVSEPLATDESSTTNYQNPFLNLNEEERDHLLDDSSGQAQVEDTKLPMSAPIVPASSRKKTRLLDVKYIRGMALKDVYNPVLRLIPRLRAKFPNLLIICDVCLCAFTSTGHCCIFEEKPRNVRDTNTKMDSFNSHHLPQSRPTGFSTLNCFPISNKITCEYLAKLAVEYALRGCNVVAPSDMMDGRILTIREKLETNGLQHVAILSYSAKFASAFYGPFRQATNNAPEFGDRRAYQLPPGSRAMALKAVKRDIKQGADFIMVKPGGPYLDIVRDIRELYADVPIAVYQVSGEYSMLKLAADANILDLKLAVNETLTSFRRAGASIIITYFTPDLLRGRL